MSFRHRVPGAPHPAGNLGRGGPGPGLRRRCGDAHRPAPPAAPSSTATAAWQRPGGRGKGVAAGGVRGIHVQRGRRRCEQNDITRSGHRRGRADHCAHHVIVLARHMENRDIRRVSGKCGVQDRGVQPEQDDTAEPITDPLHQIVDGRALELPAGDPHHPPVGLQGGERGVRIGGLGIVEVPHPVALGHQHVAVPARGEGPQAVRHRSSGDPDRQREPGSGQRVRHVVLAGGPDPIDLEQDVLAEGVVHQHLVPNAERSGERPAAQDRHRQPGRGRGQQGGRARVVDHRQRHPAGQRDGLGGGVGGHRPVPVQVILGDVEHHARGRPDRWCPVQLETRELDRDDVLPGLGPFGPGIGAGQYGLEHRPADVAAGRHPVAGGPQDRLEHSGGGRLAVGAGDHQPVPRGAARLIESPGQLDLSDHLDPRRGGGGQQRVRRRDAGRGDHQGGAVRRCLQIAGEGDIARDRRQFRWRRPVRADHHRGAGAGQVPDHRQPGDPDAGCQHQVAGGGERREPARVPPTCAAGRPAVRRPPHRWAAGDDAAGPGTSN